MEKWDNSRSGFFPAGEPEIVFKFRHEDMQKAAALDVRPKFAGNYRIKFKAEALPPRDQVGGYRLLYSHNAQFPLGQAPEGDRESMGTLARVFPALEALKTSDTNRVELVNQTIVEEVLQDLGVLDFGKGITADSNGWLRARTCATLRDDEGPRPIHNRRRAAER